LQSDRSGVKDVAIQVVAVEKRRVEFLQWHVSNRTRIVMITLLCLIPALFVARYFSPQHGFTKLLDVGPFYLPRAISQFQALDPATLHEKGYDGQFYAQLAIDPSLRNPQFATALDGPEYRSRRIFLPALAWLLGAGQPAAVVTVYTLLNLAAWYILFTLLVRSERPATVQAWLCIAAIVLTTGVFSPLKRSLTDLPAATLLVGAAVLGGWSRTVSLALSVLTKETYMICAWLPIADLWKKRHALWRVTTQVAAVLLPWILWAIYVHSRFGAPEYGEDNFAWPFKGWLHAIVSSIQLLKPSMTLAALSLLVQLAYLALWPQFKSFYWRAAISFGVAACFMNNDPFASEVSFTRDLLPMTIGFNILLKQEEPRKFPFWFAAGNIGLLSGLFSLFQTIS
jgi:hypothetical protein